MNQESFDDVSRGELAGFEPAEELLRRLPLRPPSDALDARVLPLLERMRPGGRVRAFVMGLAAAAALAAGVAPVIIQRHHPTAPSPVVHSLPPTVLAVSQGKAPTAAPRRLALNAPFAWEQTITRVADGGVVSRGGGLPAQYYRRQSVRQVVLFDPKHGTRVAVTIPTDEVVLRPIHPF
jgi:hypothetical protein